MNYFILRYMIILFKNLMMIGIKEIMKLNDLLYMIYVIFSEFKQ